MSRRASAIAAALAVVGLLLLWAGHRSPPEVDAPSSTDLHAWSAGPELQAGPQQARVQRDPIVQPGAGPLRTGFILPIRLEAGPDATIRLVGMVERPDGALEPIDSVHPVALGETEVACEVGASGQLHLEVAWAQDLERATPVGGAALTEGSVTRLPTLQLGGPKIRGRVVERGSNTAIKGVDLWLHADVDGPPVSCAATDLEGRFRFSTDGPGPYVLRTRPPARFEAPQDLVVHLASHAEQVIELQPLTPLRLRPQWRGHALATQGLAAYLEGAAGRRRVLREDPAGTFWAPAGKGTLSTWYEMGSLRCRLEDALIDARAGEPVELTLECVPSNDIGFLAVQLTGSLAVSVAQSVRVLGTDGRASGALHLVPVSGDRVIVPLEQGTYWLQAASVAAGEARVSSMASVDVRGHDLSQVDLHLLRAAPVDLILPAAGRSTLRLSCRGVSDAAWLNATFGGGHAEFIEPSDVGRFGTAVIRVFLTPGTWTGSVERGSEARALELDVKAGAPLSISPWAER